VPRPMRKIAIIATNDQAPWGGGEHCWSAVAERFARRGVQVNVSVMRWDRPVKQVENLRSVGCRIFHRPMRSLPGLAWRAVFFRKGYAWHHVKRVGAGADLVVISQSGNTDGLVWMEAARGQGLDYVLISQSGNEQWWPDDAMAERLAVGYEASRGAYFVSEANLALSRRQFVTPLGRGRVIRNPFNVRYEARPPWPGDCSEKLSLAYVAALDVRQKGHELLIQVLERPQWRARNIHVTLAGSGPYERALRKTVDNLKLTNVHFAGFVEDIEELWSHHHALVLPSRFEGLPLALVEAMLCGRPAIVTDVAGHRELVRDGVNGFLAEAPTVDLLDEAMNRAWENRHRLKEMGETAARDVRQLVSADPIGDFVRELDALVDGAAGRP
jgi:glycosyltransferase involved in cell wall biosynthesis